MTVESPEITCSSSGLDILVTITGPENAELYYTINGGDPTVEDTHYDAPFTVSNPVMVRAIAVLNGVSSDTAIKWADVGDLD